MYWSQNREILRKYKKDFKVKMRKLNWKLEMFDMLYIYTYNINFILVGKSWVDMKLFINNIIYYNIQKKKTLIVGFINFEHDRKQAYNEIKFIKLFLFFNLFL